MFETLQERLWPTIEAAVGEELIPTYSYARLYSNGDVLEKHSDRPACEISVTIQLGRSHHYAWPIYMGDKGGTNASKIMMEENDPLPPEEVHTSNNVVLFDDRGSSSDSSALTTLPTTTIDNATSPLFSTSSTSDLNLVHSHLTEEEQIQCRKAAEQYISNCKRYHVPVDPAVVIALETGWKVLQPTRRFTEGSMLPLKNILEDDKVVKKLNLSNVGMQDAR
jgi:hypothetical protein